MRAGSRAPASEPSVPLVVARREPGIVYLTLVADRLTPALDAALVRAAEEIDLDESARVVVLTSASAHFCRGAEAAPASGLEDGVAALAAVRQPVLALVRGEALDAGLELALACDLRIAAQAARLGLTQLATGRLPDRGGSQRLPRLVGASRALAMLLLAETVTARRAAALGLVHEVVPGRTLARRGDELAAALAARAPIALRLAKEALRAAHDLPLAEGLRLEGDLYVLLQTTRDRDEGIVSFRDKRAPRFTGR